MTSMSRLLQDNFCGKNSWKSIKYSKSYDTVCQFKGLNLTSPANLVPLCSSLSKSELLTPRSDQYIYTE